MLHIRVYAYSDFRLFGKKKAILIYDYVYVPIVSYRAFIISYCACILSGFAFVYRESRSSGISFIVYQVLHLSSFLFIVYQVLRVWKKPRDLLYLLLIIGLSNIADS